MTGPTTPSRPRTRHEVALRLLLAAGLGAIAVGGQVVGIDLGHENPAYSDRLAMARFFWLAAACLAAAIASPGWRGWLAAWLGSLVGAWYAADRLVATSPTTRADPFWWYVAIIGLAVYAAVGLGLAQVVVYVGAGGSTRWRRAVPSGLLIVLAVASVVLFTLPEPAYDSPQPAPTAPPAGDRDPAASPGMTPAPLVPSPTPAPTRTAAPARPPLDIGDVQGSDIVVTGALVRDGSYTIRTAIPEDTVVGAIPDIEGRIPEPWSLLDSAWTSPQLSRTGFLALDLTSGPKGDENSAVGVFDVLAPGADPLVAPSNGGGFRMTGDRLWVRAGESDFAVYDLPSATPVLVSLGTDADVPSPFYASAAGDAVLVRSGGTDGELRLVDGTGAERDLQPGEALVGPKGLERLLGPDGARLMTGSCPGAASSADDLCIIDALGNVAGYSVPGRLIDVAWDPGQEIPVWVSTTGVGIIRNGTVTRIVRLGDWKPVRIAGFWSNVVILASDASPRLAFAVTGPDAITDLPMPPDSIVTLPGEALLGVFPGEDVPE